LAACSGESKIKEQLGNLLWFRQSRHPWKESSRRESSRFFRWFIDPRERRVYVFRVGEEVEVLTNVATVSADPLLPGFELRLEELW
jgi:hypothetical protein